MDDADFEDDRALINKEARFRRHTLKVFNKRREDFSSDREFDDYLEMIEDIVFNLSNDVDVGETKARVEIYKRENQELIGQNQALRSEEERRGAETLARAERERVAKLTALRKRDAEIEEEARRKRRELELEEMQRVSLGEAEAARLKKKKERKLLKEQLQLEKQAAEEAAARAKAAEVDTRPMYCRPAFPCPPPQAVLSVPGDRATVFSTNTRGAAGGWRQATEMERAKQEFAEALRFAIAS
jgi:CDK-activating kinase assembly factor MAT1